jgi:phage gp36-like protein
MAATALSVVYTTVARMERRVGKPTLLNWTDRTDSGQVDEDSLIDSINWATEECDLHLRQRGYSQAGLAASEIVQAWATDLACFHSSGNGAQPEPEMLIARVESVYERLNSVMLGRMKLPGVSFDADLSPGWSNRQVDRRHRHDTVRVTRTNSSRTASKKQRDFLTTSHNEI